MKKSHLLATVATGAVLATTVGFAATGGFTDQGSFAEWFAPSVQKMEFNKVITGYPDGSFGPANSVSRAELAVMLDRFATAIGIPLDSGPRACTMQFVYGLTLRVQDEKGQAISDATIEVDGTADDHGDYVATDGMYATMGEMEGYRNLKVAKEGYTSHEETIRLEKDGCHVIPQKRTITLIHTGTGTTMGE